MEDAYIVEYMNGNHLHSPPLPYASWTLQRNGHSYTSDSYSLFGALPRLLSLTRGTKNHQPVYLTSLTVTKDDVKDFMSHRKEYVKTQWFQEFEVKIFI